MRSVPRQRYVVSGDLAAQFVRARVKGCSQLTRGPPRMLTAPSSVGGADGWLPRRARQPREETDVLVRIGWSITPNGLDRLACERLGSLACQLRFCPCTVPEIRSRNLRPPISSGPVVFLSLGHVASSGWFRSSLANVLRSVRFARLAAPARRVRAHLFAEIREIVHGLFIENCRHGRKPVAGN